jgi:S1-C subfamily serine protease
MKNWLVYNVTKIILTLMIVLSLFLNIVYMQDINKHLIIFNSKINLQLVTLQETQNKSFNLLAKALVIIMEEVIEIEKSNQYIIDQNREKLNQTSKVIQENATSQKPSYEELKAHTVFIVGCSNKKLDKNQLTYSIDDEGMCWAGTGVVVKITDTETYILTNNHVAGKTQKNVTLYVQDNNRKFKEAQVVKYHSFVDCAVIKIKQKLEEKTAITKISYGKISESVYIVGHPLGNKYIYTEGVVAGFKDFSLFLQAPCIYGNSGSGVFNSKGELIGLVYALQSYPGLFGIIPRPQITHALAVDSISIKTFLEELGLYNDN